MIFDWQQYLVLSDNLYKNCGSFSNQEACLRAAISRSYYAAFCTARNLARDRDGLTLLNTGEDHGLVKEHFGNDRNTERRKIGNFLRKLKDLRRQADYVDNVSNLIDTTEAALTYAHKIIELLERIYKI